MHPDLDLPETWERHLYQEFARMRDELCRLLSLRTSLNRAGLTEERCLILEAKRGCRR